MVDLTNDVFMVFHLQSSVCLFALRFVHFHDLKIVLVGTLKSIDLMPLELERTLHEEVVLLVITLIWTLWWVGNDLQREILEPRKKLESKRVGRSSKRESIGLD
jgi:hypothetical protein